MKILAIDHATVHGGSAVFDGTSFSEYEAIDLRDFPMWSPAYAMMQVVDVLIQNHKPDYVALEKPMAMRNAEVARKLIEVYAACKLAAEMHDVPVVEVTPQLAKMYTAGHARAEKEDVARAIQAQFKLPFDSIAPPVYYKDKKRKGQIKERLWDVSDSMAIAIAAKQILHKEAVEAR